MDAWGSRGRAAGGGWRRGSRLNTGDRARSGEEIISSGCNFYHKYMWTPFIKWLRITKEDGTQ